jgi:hypothetical protein
MAKSEYIPKIVDGRSIGETIPVSIGTAIALEQFVDSQEMQSAYNSLWINVRTIFRNLVGSYEKTPTKLQTGPILDAFEDEIREIVSIKSKYLSNGFDIHLYFPTYNSVPNVFIEAKIKEPTTKLQLEEAKLERQAWERLKVFGDLIKRFDIKINGKQSLGLMLTHYPIDLFSVTTFKKLSLLESHTGVVKERPEWITKISKNTAYSNLPFNLLTIQVVGDGKTFHCMGKAFTNALLKVADGGKWTTLTTRDKVKFDLARINDKYTGEEFTKMLTVSLK